MLRQNYPEEGLVKRQCCVVSEQCLYATVYLGSLLTAP